MKQQFVHNFSALISGILFGAGLIISGMTDPQKVVGFLDISGNWDPALGFVMASALCITTIGMAIARRRAKPIAALKFRWPARTDIDASLLTGSALFGIGWGLAGYCPGPAIVSLGYATPEILTFVAAMLTGMAVFHFRKRNRAQIISK